MSLVSQGFNDKQKKGLVRADSPDDVPPHCPQNFNGFSECHAAIVFNSFPSPLSSSSNISSFNATSFNASDPSSFSYPNAINYTIRADGGLYHIDVRGRSDYERRIFPIQLALDKAIAELSANVTLPTPQEWPFTQQTNEEQRTQIRLSM
jgi:ATP-binding cassette, subfamily A (ABC1), member 3